MGRRLFARGPRGYGLTGAGRALLAEAEALREISARLRRFADQSDAVTVRITAGHWTSLFIARGLPSVWSRDAAWKPAFVASTAFVDIARREADIGIRSRRPDQPWMAGRQIGRVEMASYATDRNATGFICMAESQIRSQRWIREQHGNSIVAEVSDQRLACDLALAGIGQIVLPRFVAPLFPDLHQTGPVIEELTRPAWLVSHHDARHDPPIRAALDAIARLLTES